MITEGCKDFSVSLGISDGYEVVVVVGVYIGKRCFYP